ncbi:MAG: TolC family protein [Campylobacterota bacterium]
MKKLAFTLLLTTTLGFAVSIEQIVSSGLENSRDLKSINYSIKIANENIKLASKYSDPMLTFGVNDIWLNKPFKRDKEAMQASYIGISQVIPTNNKLEIKEQIAKKDMKIQSLVLEEKKLKLKSKIYELAYSIVVLEEKLGLLNEYEQNLIKLQTLSTDFYKLGNGNQNEVLNTKVLLLNLKIKKEKFENIINNLYLKLEQVSYMKIRDIDIGEKLKKLVLNMDSNKHPKIKQGYIKAKKYIYLSKLERAKKIPDIKVNLSYFSRDSKFEDYANISVNIPLTINNTQSVKSLKAKFKSNEISSKLDDTKEELQVKFKSLLNSANSALRNYKLIRTEIIPIKNTIQNNLENYNSFLESKPQMIIKNLNSLISFEMEALDEKFEYFSNYAKTKYYILEDK